MKFPTLQQWIAISTYFVHHEMFNLDFKNAQLLDFHDITPQLFP